MKCVGILQARTGSTRLPEKVLKKIKGKSLLELYVNRIKPSKQIEQIVIATTTLSEDDRIEAVTRQLGLHCFRGSENDLIDRYYQCALEFKADIIVRITPDDPFVDYQVVDRAIEIFKDNSVDFVTNHFNPTFPEGLDVEVYSMRALERCWKRAKLYSDREHVSPYIHSHQNEFKIINFEQEEDLSNYRWTIDHECDFQMASSVYDYLYEKNKIFLQQDIVELLREHPEISEMNCHIQRKEGLAVSRAKDNE